MKRSNFTFLLLFAVFGLVSFNVQAQGGSSSCVDKNVIVDPANCEFAVADLLGGATGPAAGATWATIDGVPYPVSGSGSASGSFGKECFTYALFADETAATTGGPMLCWGEVCVEVKNAPTITPYTSNPVLKMCGITTPMSATAVTDQSVIDYVVDNYTCLPSHPIVTTTSSPQTSCYGSSDSKSWYVHFEIKGVATPKQLVTTQLTIDSPVDVTTDILCPPSSDPANPYTYECGTDVSPAGIEAYWKSKLDKHTTPKAIYDAAGLYEAYPRKEIGTKTLWFRPGVTTCNVSAKFVDMKFAGCTGPDTKTMRTWSFLDWCTGTTYECVQWIELVDTKAPKVTAGNDDDVTLSTEPWICTATHAVKKPSFSDACDASLTIVVSATAGTFNSSKTVLSGLPYGVHTVTWKATDDCGNFTTWSYDVAVHDLVEPVVVTDDKINATLTWNPGTGDGLAKVYAQDIDEGSHDAGCGPVSICVYRPEDFEIPVYDCDGDFIGYKPVTCGAAVDYVDAGRLEPLNKKNCIYIGKDYVAVSVCADAVKFCCEDIGENKVVLKAWDQDGNYAHGWTIINVEDKSGAGWTYVKDWVDCHFTDNWNPKKPYYGGVICKGFDVKEISREEDITCGEGYIYITWGAYDAAGNQVGSSKTFKYEVHPAEDFDPYSIKWPKHYTGDAYEGYVRECEKAQDDWKGIFTHVVEYGDHIPMGDPFECEDDGDTGEPVWCNTRCSVIGKSFEDETVVADDACKKIIRRWTVVDWCTWVPNGKNVDDENDGKKDRFEAIDDEWLTPDALTYAPKVLRWDYHGNIEVDDITALKHDPNHKSTYCLTCEKPSGTPDYVYFRYRKVDEDGYYTFDQVIKIIDETDPTIDAPATHTVAITDGAKAKGGTFENCKGSDVISATATDVCGTSELDASSIVWWIEVYNTKTKKVIATKSSVGASATMSTQTGVPGDKYEIRWIAKDGCGNTSKVVTVVDFKDTKKPTPVCLQDISTATMNVAGGPVSIWAKDYDLGSFDNCSAVSVYFKDASGKAVPSLSFTCADIPNGVSRTVELNLYVKDASGNEDYCFVTLRIDDNSDVCPDVDGGAAAISGYVATSSGDRVESAKVSLNGASTSTTKVDGIYAFASNPMYSNYSVRAEKNDDFMNGVSTLDLVLIQKHVLGLQTLDSPYKVISADVNGDSKISAIDLVELRKLILGVYTSLPNNKSWRFVDAKQEFASVLNPFPFKENIDIANLSASVTNGNFVAAKIGDVSGNAIANSLLAGGTRSAGTLSFEVAERSVKAGETVRVEVRSDNFSDVAAYQFTMNVKGLTLTGVESGSINVDKDNFGLLNESTITTAWFNSSPVSSSDVLFTMTFRANSNVDLSKAIELGSQVTKAEAYNANNERMDVELVFNKGTETVSSAAMELYQNEPNPFDNVTKIGFKLAQAGQATLTVFDVTGKTVSVVKGQYNKGYNEITLKKSELNASGVMYYQLESGEFTATKKMILID